VRIDAHQHFWRPARGDYGWLTPDQGVLYRDFGPDELAPHLAAHGIDRTVLVQAAPTDAETDFLLDLAQSTPSIAAVVGWLDMEAPDATARLTRRARDPRFRGIRPMIQDIADPDWMLRATLTPVFGALIDLGLTFDALVRPAHLPNLARLLDRHPDLEVVVDHGGKPSIATRGFEPWARDIARIAAGSRAFCKLSGLVTEAGSEASVAALAPYAAHLVACFGAERLMWGSDWPVLLLAGDYGSWWQTTATLLEGVSERERASILGGTAAEFYGIGGRT
jgi:L-fuconolactonase